MKSSRWCLTVAQYEFADVDEDNIGRPSEPEFARRHGPRPLIVRCESPIEEVSAVTISVRSLLAMGHMAGQICVVGPARSCGLISSTYFEVAGIEHTDLKQDVHYESDRVKRSAPSNRPRGMSLMLLHYGACSGGLAARRCGFRGDFAGSSTLVRSDDPRARESNDQLQSSARLPCVSLPPPYPSGLQ